MEDIIALHGTKIITEKEITAALSTLISQYTHCLLVTAITEID